jgi:hypothetical protein
MRLELVGAGSGFEANAAALVFKAVAALASWISHIFPKPAIERFVRACNVCLALTLQSHGWHSREEQSWDSGISVSRGATRRSVHSESSDSSNCPAHNEQAVWRVLSSHRASRVKRTCSKSLHSGAAPMVHKRCCGDGCAAQTQVSECASHVTVHVTTSTDQLLPHTCNDAGSNGTCMRRRPQQLLLFCNLQAMPCATKVVTIVSCCYIASVAGTFNTVLCRTCGPLPQPATNEPRSLSPAT